LFADEPLQKLKTLTFQFNEVKPKKNTKRKKKEITEEETEGVVTESQPIGFVMEHPTEELIKKEV
jgi:hypothetical protein